MGHANRTPALREWDLPEQPPRRYLWRMTLIVHFEPRNMNATTYAEVMRRLETAGASAPRGRLHHAAYGSPEALRVVDIWDTAESFQAFGATLVPILTALGVELPEPVILPVTNIVRG
jgi:hypothetical protein